MVQRRRKRDNLFRPCEPVGHRSRVVALVVIDNELRKMAYASFWARQAGAYTVNTSIREIRRCCRETRKNPLSMLH